MSGPRAARPTDIVALVAFDGRVYANEAQPWERLGSDRDGPHVLGSAFEQWFSFATNRATWVSVQGQTVRGVIGARRRASRAAWEIDTLIAADEESGPVALSLFDQALGGIARAGGRIVYLRMPAGSDLLPAAQRAGFVTYAHETLLRFDSAATASDHGGSLGAVNGLTGADSAVATTLRPREKGDAHALYQLYCAVTPAHVRAQEAATFQEWLAAEERLGRGRGRLDLISERASRAQGWLRGGRDGGIGRLDLLVHPEAWPETDALLETGIAALREVQTVFSLVREYAAPVRQRLESAGFRPCGEFVALAKRLAVPVRALQPRRSAVPALVKPLIGSPLLPVAKTRR